MQSIEMKVLGVLGEVANGGVDAHEEGEGRELERKDVVAGEVLLLPREKRFLLA